MNICKKEKVVKEKIPDLIRGHLYKNRNSGLIYLCTTNYLLVNVDNGNAYGTGGFMGKGTQFSDVTDNYCLTEV